MPKIRGVKNDPTYFLLYCPGCDSPHAFRACPKCSPTFSRPPNSPCTECKNQLWMFNYDREKPTIRESILSNKDRDCPDLPRCHSYVTDGRIQFLPDSTHALAGQTVDLPEYTYPDASDDE